MKLFIRRILLIIYYKIKCCSDVKLHLSCNIEKGTNFEGMCQVHSHTSFYGELGFGSYIGHNSSLSAKVGRFCSIANNVRSNGGIHPYKAPFVSTAPCFCVTNRNGSQNGGSFATRNVFKQFRKADEKKGYDVEIGNDVWVGENVFFVGGVHVGDGAVVLANATVTKNVPPYAIVGGTPARVLGYRFDEETIDWLLKIQWWNNEPIWFKQNWELMCDINKLRGYYNNV